MTDRSRPDLPYAFVFECRTCMVPCRLTAFKDDRWPPGPPLCCPWDGTMHADWRELAGEEPGQRNANGD